MNMFDGMLVLYKPPGITSHDAVEMVRKAYGVKAGHAGTLDPIAQGVLLVFINNALKLLQFLPFDLLDKTYLMKITLGKSTNTYDSTGEVTFSYQNEINLNIDKLMATLEKFVGQIKQKPPPFSALKIDGKRAYELARSGKPVDLKPRTIYINSIRLIKVLQTYKYKQTLENSFNHSFQHHLLLRVHCSRGTYIRSLANDIGLELGYGGYLSYLLRERVGCWTFKQAFPIWKVVKKLDFTSTESFVKITDILPFPKVIIKDEALKKVLNGAQLNANDVVKFDNFQYFHNLQGKINDKLSKIILQVFSKDNELLALYTNKDDKNTAHYFQSKFYLIPLRIIKPIS